MTKRFNDMKITIQHRIIFAIERTFFACVFVYMYKFNGLHENVFYFAYSGQ